MDPFTIAALIITAAAAVVYFWPYIADFFHKYAIPKTRELLGSEAADLLRDLVVFLDNGVCKTRARLVRAWRFMTATIGIITKVVKTGANTAQTTTEAYYRTKDDRVVKEPVVEELKWP